MNDRIKAPLALLGQVIGCLVMALGVFSLGFGILNYDEVGHGIPVGLVIAFVGLVFVVVGYGLVRVIQLLRGPSSEGAAPRRR